MFDFDKQKEIVDFKDYVSQYNELSGLFLNCCCAENEGENVLISPMSILMLLAMASDSTSGKTRDEVLDFLGNPDAGRLLSALQRSFENDSSLSVANAACIRNEFASKINRSYKELLKRKYNGEVFSSVDMVRDINKWVEKKTYGMIRNAAPEGIENLVISLISAVAFDALWEDPYTDYQVEDDCFDNIDETKSRVWMMSRTEEVYLENHDFTGFMKPYRDGRFSFMALLPKKEGTKALSGALSRIDFAELYRKRTCEQVRTKMPEFKFEYSKEMCSLLATHGINRLFTDDAEFLPVCADSLKAESILHKAYIDVNQNGTRAAAVSVMACPLGIGWPPPKIKEVYLDRPFVFAIFHETAGIPVFVGVVNHLEDLKGKPEMLRRERRRNRKIKNC